MNRRAFFSLIIIAVLVFIIITGTSVYFNFKKGGIQISTGNTVVDVSYNVSKASNETNNLNESIEIDNNSTEEEYDSVISIMDENQSSNLTYG